MKKIIALVLLAVMLSGVACAKTKNYVEPEEMQTVELGETFDEVVGKIGNPQQVASKELTSDGKQKVVWLYEAIPAPKQRTTTGFGGTGQLMDLERQYQARRITNPPYLIIFIDGKVSSIKRQ